ncbi:hypothetical protein KO566_09635 [Flavobacteriaceae bacterium XHP0103]|uniref:hypothetical protein n=1 Tax=Marixanthotalea marina TaxID=2844359 RepID=UPI002989C59B|nr:hypothetical protein [Marixanthotalea marina]MBU3822322.1 hypothetical protein [Marixanthotalea marina]
MKTLLLFLLGTLLSVNVATANEHLLHKDNLNKRYRYAQPITFVERGVEFLIFPDGSFDFNTHYNAIYYGNSRRNTINATYNGPRATVSFSTNVNRGTSIVRDRFGNIRSIGNIYLNYDRFGNVTRIGSVFIDYGRGRNNTVTQVGGLKVNYNRWGEITNTRGFVNRESQYVAYDVRPHNDWDNDYDHFDDNSHYYYKRNGEVKKHKKRR